MGFFDTLFGRRPAPQVQRGDLIVKGPHAVFLRREPSGLCLVAIDVPIAEGARPPGYEHCFRVVLRSSMAATHADGLPHSGELQRLNQEEYAFVDELVRRDVDCIKVGHFTQGGARELVFQCADATSFEAAYATWSAGRAPFVELRRGHGWAFFDEVLQPRPRDRDWLLNARTIDTAIKLGTDRGALHRIDHVFIGPHAALVGLMPVLRASGSTDIEWVGDDLIMRERMRLEVESITDRTQRLRALAAEHAVTYDGWGTPVMKP